MEQGSMTATDLSILGSENLLHTYFSLGMASPGTVISKQEGFDVCMGNFDHPICNFAGRLSLDPWAANRLVELALERKFFTVYSVAADTPRVREHRDELLVRAGFQKNFSLQQLFWLPQRSESSIHLQIPRSPAEKSAIAIFMAQQFFPRHAPAFKRRIAEATSGSDLPLYGIYHKLELIGAVMLVEDDNLVGLFNLCVKSNQQNRGIGANIVAGVKQLAYELGKPISLQCETALTAWYQRQDFVVCDWVDVYGLSDQRRLAIMN